MNVTLTGRNFGLSPLIFIGGVSCPIKAKDTNHTQLICVLPAGQGASRVVQVQVATQLSNEITFDYNGPTLTSILPNAGPTAGGSLVVIRGTSLGLSGIVSIGGSTCTQQKYNHTTIECLTPGAFFTLCLSVLSYLKCASSCVCHLIPVFHSRHLPPAGEGTGRDVQVISSSLASNIITYDYAAPVVSAVTPNNGPTAGGTRIVISGSNFGLSASAKIGSQQCTPIYSRNHTHIECLLPAGQGIGTTNLVTVTVISRTSANLVYFLYDPPVITGISPEIYATNGFTIISLYGRNFGSSGVVRFGGTQCLPTGPGFAHTSVTCVLPCMPFLFFPPRRS
jgi:hypothetical protein